jgi:hypothetical protein
MVSVITLTPSAVVDAGRPVRVQFALLGTPATKVTVEFLVTEANVAVRVLLSAVVEDKVAMTTPDALVITDTGDNVLFEPVLLKETA